MKFPFKIFIGYDKREDIAYQVCKFSIERHTKAPIEIYPIKIDNLREQKIYARQNDPLASTEFTYSRFLTPYLSHYKGWSLFCDCDILFTTDIAEILSYIDNTKAVLCVHHNHIPSEKQKMDGVPQTVYHRKNWSSVVLYNCEHPANKILTPTLINTQTGSYLHQFQWLSDDLIGQLPEEWNWLEGWCKKTDTLPKAIHYTRGGPWFENLSHNLDYADIWLNEKNLMHSPTTLPDYKIKDI
jgi:lipopolysaccharide biosynthesis glycosyltransferase